jgi:hypothetical protein
MLCHRDAIAVHHMMDSRTSDTRLDSNLRRGNFQLDNRQNTTQELGHRPRSVTPLLLLIANPLIPAFTGAKM